MVLSMKLISIAFDMDADIQKELMNPKPKKTEERVEEIAISKKGTILWAKTLHVIFVSAYNFSLK